MNALCLQRPRADTPASRRHPAAGIDVIDRALLLALQDGLPLTPRPYQVIGGRVGLTEDETLQRLSRLLVQGVIKRLGVIVRHRELGYRANAMVVWDVADEEVHEIGRRLAACEPVRLCYRRPRRPPDWPYNLFCMIHGRTRAEVWEKLDGVIGACGLGGIAYDVLFSTRRFKQCGARYGEAPFSSRAEIGHHG